MNRPSVFVPRRLSAVDLALLDFERSHAPLNLAALAVFEGRVSPDRLALRIESRLWRLGNLGRTIAPVPFALTRPSFEDPPRFDPRDHVHGWALPAPGGEAQLLDACARVLARALDRGRPLFEVHVFEGLDGERSAVLLQLHCALARSSAGGALLEALLDSTADGSCDLAQPRRSRRRATAVTRLGRALGDDVLGGLRDVARALAVATDPRAARDTLSGLTAAGGKLLDVASDAPPLFPWNAEVGWRRQLALTGLPLADVRRVAARHGCGVTEVIVSAIGGALHGYLCGAGAPLPRTDARVLVPRFVRGHDAADALAELQAVVVPVPIEIADEVVRLGAVVRALRVEQARDAGGSASTALLGLADRLPRFFTRALARGLRLERLANVVSATLEGPREARWLCGQRLLAVHPFFPVVDGVGLSFASYSYAGRLFVGLNADADLVTDLDKLRLELESSFASLLRTA